MKITSVEGLTALPSGTVLLDSRSITPHAKLVLPALVVTHDDFVETRFGLLAHDEAIECFPNMTVIHSPEEAL